MIAIDWGTSSFRAYRLNAAAEVLQQRSAALGLLSCQGRFEAILAEQLQGWDDGDIIMAGMIGSRNGWREVPYVRCPAGLPDIAAGCIELEAAPLPGRRIVIVPGLSDQQGLTPEVMRGEEVQVLGLADQLPGDGPHTLCLPGTHSKWVQCQRGSVQSLRTAMTGELYALLRKQSLLSALMPAEGEDAPDAAAFERGIQASGAAGGLSHHLFGVRTLGLFEGLTPAQAPSYLSGLLIGHELRALMPAAADVVHLIGDAALVQRYSAALSLLGMASQTHGQALSARGLFRVMVRHA